MTGLVDSLPQWGIPLLSLVTLGVWGWFLWLTVDDYRDGGLPPVRAWPSFWVAVGATVVALAFASLVYPGILDQEMTRATTFTLRWVLLASGIWGLSYRLLAQKEK